MAPFQLNLPPSQGHTVHVSIINGARSHMPTSLFVEPTIKGHDTLRMACYSFLIESTHRQQKILFDLAFMKELDASMPPALKRLFEGGPGAVDSTYDIPDTLTANSVPLSSINNIIWSHSHIDHVGDPSVFLPSTTLIVGPGLLAVHRPGYPTNPEGFLLDSAFQGREVREVDFNRESTTEIGGFRAVDFFHDGSFYLLEGTGHTDNHLCALARTTEDSFVLMAGDACHHVGTLRPSESLPLPETVSPDVRKSLPKQGGSPGSCTCSSFKTILPLNGTGGALYNIAPGMHESPIKAIETVERLKAFDARDDIFVIIAHDWSLLDVVDFFPQRLDHWKEKKWGEVGRWRFLEDFRCCGAMKLSKEGRYV